MTHPRASENDSVRMRPCLPADAELLAEIAAQSFIESHGHSASAADIHNYVAKAFSLNEVKHELANPKNHFHFLSLENVPFGYSKFILNTSIMIEGDKSYCKLERVYLLDEFQGRGFGKLLLEHAIGLAKLNGQQGMWLHVWVENLRAVDFYTRSGFEIVGKFDFRISPGHVNPNHQMLLTW